MPARRRPPARKDHRSPAVLVDLTDQELLDLRLKDLGLTVEGSAVEPRLERLAAELDREGLFQPYAWLSTDWFTPDGCTGFAVPFYLAHSRLVRLERAQMLEVEGGSADECLRILRHEAAHAIDNAYGLRRRKRWRQVFGSPTEPYESSYSPDPTSRAHVLNLGYWYSQSHPLEDWAETFAVWLGSAGRWRRRYEGWTALAKLEYVDELMTELRGKPPRLRTRTREDSLPSLRLTADTGYQSQSTETLFDDLIWSVAAGIVGPVFDAGRRAAEVRRTDAVLREALAQYEQALLDAMAEVENALLQEQEQRRHVEALEKRVAASRSLLEATRDRYQNGLSDYLPVLTALTTLQADEQSYLTAKRQLLSYRVQLHRALGGDWSVVDTGNGESS